MLALSGHKAKFDFITKFHGIAAKYGRNIWMDLADPDFETCIAVDERVKAIAKALGVSSAKYATVEAFFVECAREAHLTPWEADRLMYNFNGYFLAVIEDAGNEA
ncbi:hypothetical protein SAMN05428960_0321 [Mitsuaria sp. PDC51]|uniref:hypothetical protein n=1 Tax=Mitsuaria sp. PDC51 TaxID=1881035 RepID=UPI0008EC0D74|nr:hypothetical protein [Mitsuaria sp. PDC51]SFR71088.1 hypothetical protein SAMN05428960_0321 [Mitsuaria sp. PDC51]